MKRYLFRSIMTENIEKVVPGTVLSRVELDFNENTSASHTLEITLKDILTDRAWRTGLAVSLMACLGVFGLGYGLMIIIMKKPLAGASGFTIKAAYFSAAAAVCFLLWFFITLKVGLSNKKRDLVEKERGKGNWRIVDEKDWDRFVGLMNAGKKSRGM